VWLSGCASNVRVVGVAKTMLQKLIDLLRRGFKWRPSQKLGSDNVIGLADVDHNPVCA
jgi:hypothetical protein